MPYTIEYWEIGPGRDGSLQQYNISQEWFYRAKRDSWYCVQFQDHVARTITRICIPTYAQCDEFAAWCYTTIKAGQWNKVNLAEW